MYLLALSAPSLCFVLSSDSMILQCSRWPAGKISSNVMLTSVPAPCDNVSGSSARYCPSFPASSSDPLVLYSLATSVRSILPSSGIHLRTVMCELLTQPIISVTRFPLSVSQHCDGAIEVVSIGCRIVCMYLGKSPSMLSSSCCVPIMRRSFVSLAISTMSPNVQRQ